MSYTVNDAVSLAFASAVLHTVVRRGAHIDWVEVACCVTNDTHAIWWRRLLKEAPEVVSFGVDGDWRHRLGFDQGVVDGREGQVSGPLQKALLICRAVVAWVA